MSCLLHRLEFVKRMATCSRSLTIWDTNSSWHHNWCIDFLERLEPYGLTPFVTLVCLLGRRWSFYVWNCRKLGQLGATTWVVDRMEDRKLVYRERDSEDRRIVRIWLTWRRELNALPQSVSRPSIRHSKAFLKQRENSYQGARSHCFQRVQAVANPLGLDII